MTIVDNHFIKLFDVKYCINFLYTSVMIISLNFCMQRLDNKAVRNRINLCVDIIWNNVTKWFYTNPNPRTNCFHDCTACLHYVFVFYVKVCAHCTRTMQYLFHDCTYWISIELTKIPEYPKSQNQPNLLKIPKFSKKYQKSWKIMKNYEKVGKSV